MSDVYEEVYTLAVRYIGEECKFRCRAVTRKYAFELPDIPRESD